MLIGIIILIVSGIISSFLSLAKEELIFYNYKLCIKCIILAIILCFIGLFTGYIYYPATNGVHQGIITAVDLEGVFFRRYEIYIKSGGYSKDSNGNVSDETKYLLYDYEKELAEQLQNAIGKEVKIYYGHDGGYIGWKSCGTYHIKKVELIEEDNNE